MTSLTNREAVYDDENKTPVVWKDDYIFEVKPGVTAVIPVADSSVEYKVVKEDGPAHDKTFEVDVIIDNITYGHGVGKSKKEAEQKAAYDAYSKCAK